VPAALERAGVKEIFHGVAIKPGKPVFFGRAGSHLVFGMPGNPQSCFVIFHMLVAPAVAAMSGATELPPLFREGSAAEDFDVRATRMSVIPCKVSRRDSVNVLHRCTYHGSADIVGASEADAYMVVPRGSERVNEGDRLRFFVI
jgi:molybdopterin molybdotransferase